NPGEEHIVEKADNAGEYRENAPSQTAVGRHPPGVGAPPFPEPDGCILRHNNGANPTIKSQDTPLLYRLPDWGSKQGLRPWAALKMKVEGVMLPRLLHDPNIWSDDIALTVVFTDRGMVEAISHLP
ncbi:hypothetical protein FOZ63_018542, partial [Perkinsus olseni]